MCSLTPSVVIVDVLFAGWCLPLWSECGDPPAASGFCSARLTCPLDTLWILRNATLHTLTEIAAFFT